MPGRRAPAVESRTGPAAILSNGDEASHRRHRSTPPVASPGIGECGPKLQPACPPRTESALGGTAEHRGYVDGGERSSCTPSPVVASRHQPFVNVVPPARPKDSGFLIDHRQDRTQSKRSREPPVPMWPSNGTRYLRLPASSQRRKTNVWSNPHNALLKGETLDGTVRHQ